LDIGPPLGRIDEAGLKRRLAVMEAEGAHEPVAVEPVAGIAAGAAKLAGAVTVERAGQAFWTPPRDQLHRRGPVVRVEVGESQAPVDATGGAGFELSRGVGKLGCEERGQGDATQAGQKVASIHVAVQN